jgi:two-component system cell cycle response regulator
MESARKKPDDDKLPPPAADATVVGPMAVRLPTERRHASLIVVQGAEIGREYRIRRVESILGRDEGVALRFPDERVSRQHVRITIKRRFDGSTDIVVKDLDSRNGTWVNGKRIKGSVTLADGDKLQIGDTILKFILQDDLDARFHEEVRYRVAYDQLTGLLNKESFDAALDSELRRCSRHQLPLVVLMMDLDRFKLVNDTHGHLMGSFVLREIGRLLKDNFRATDVAARYGGEEFVAYLAESPVSEGRAVADRIRGAIEKHRFSRKMENGVTLNIDVTISIGVAQFPVHGTTANELIAAGDQALYRAKAEGRNRVCVALASDDGCPHDTAPDTGDA